MSEINNQLRSDDDELSQGKASLPQAVSEQRKSLIEAHNTDEVLLEDNLNLSNSQLHQEPPQIQTTSNTNIQNPKEGEISSEDKAEASDNSIPKEQTELNDPVQQDKSEQSPKSGIISSNKDDKEQIQPIDKTNDDGFYQSNTSQEAQQDKQKQVLNTSDSSHISTKVINESNNTQNVGKVQQELNNSVKRKKDNNLTLQIQTQFPSREELEEQNKKLLEELEAMKRIVAEKNNRITALELELAAAKKSNEQKKQIPSYLEGAQYSKKEHQPKRIEEPKPVQDKNSGLASFWDIPEKNQPVIKTNSKVNLDQVIGQDTLWINQREKGDIFEKQSIQKDKGAAQQSNISIKLDKNNSNTNGIPQQMITQDFQDQTPSQKSYSVHEQTPSKQVLASNKVSRNQILHQEYSQPQYIQYQQQQQYSNQRSPMLSQGKQNIIKKGDQYQHYTQQQQQQYQKQTGQYNQGEYQQQSQKAIVKKYYYHEQQNEDYQGVNQSQGNGLSSIKKGVLIRQKDDQEFQEEYSNRQKIYQNIKPNINGRSISNSQLKGARLSPLKYEVQKRRMS